jgi:predicted fused transcriptional regulator/phosphomethylpyrimidine kinase
MKVYVDEYNSMGGDDHVPPGIGSCTNLISWDLVKDTDWEACSYGRDYKPKVVEISEEDYIRFHEACKTIHEVIDRVYEQVGDWYDE